MAKIELESQLSSQMRNHVILLAARLQAPVTSLKLVKSNRTDPDRGITQKNRLISRRMRVRVGVHNIAVATEDLNASISVLPFHLTQPSATFQCIRMPNLGSLLVRMTCYRGILNKPMMVTKMLQGCSLDSKFTPSNLTTSRRISLQWLVLS